METIAHYFLIRGNTIHAIEFGNGKKLLICFHGFGEDAEKYLVLAPSLNSFFNVMAIDLPFHGKTKWNGDHHFLLTDLRELILQIIELKNKNEFSLFGYSLGGKMVLSVLNLFPARVTNIILAAPDGIKKNQWYNVAVYPTWGQKLFKQFVIRPEFVFKIARMLRALKIIDETLFKFLKVQTDTLEKRYMIFQTWMTLKEMKIDISKTKNLINSFKIKSVIFIGRYDRIISVSSGKKFCMNLASAELIKLDKGHNLITEFLNEPLENFLSKK